MILESAPASATVCPACRVPHPAPDAPCSQCGQTWSQAVLAPRPAYVTPAPVVGSGATPPPQADTRRPAGTLCALIAELAPASESVHTLAATPAAPPGAAPAPLPPPPAPPRRKVKLVVLRGQRIGVEYPVYEGTNTIGRFADRPVDIDLLTQEAVEQIWCSRQHAVFLFDGQTLAVEDLNSLNGTWVNGKRLTAGVQHVLKVNDVVQVGTVQMRVLID